MARLWSCGFELQSVTAGVEFDSTSGTAPSIDTGTVYSGSASVKFNPSAATSYLQHQFAATSATNNVYVRFYAYFTAFPGANDITIAVIRSAAAGNNLTIRANTAGTIYLKDEQAAAQVGSTSSALSLNRWYMIEFSYVYATGFAAAYINGVNFTKGGKGTASVATDTIRLGFVDSATGTYFADDIAINDNNAGGTQTTLVGSTKLLYLRPNAAGELSEWTPTAGANYTNVDETTPNDATDIVSTSLTTKTDFYTIASSGLNQAIHTINVVSVGGRFNNPTADVTTAFKFQIEKLAGGTKTQSASIIPNSTTWKTNAIVVPVQYPLTTYTDPDSVNWTPATLNNSQIGVVTGAIGVFGIQLSTIWVLVDYSPKRTRPVNYGNYVTVGNNMGRAEVAN